MAVITRNDILEIAEPFEAMYGSMANQIMIQMAEYIGKDIDKPIDVWQKEMVQLISRLLKDVKSIQSEYPYSATIRKALNDTVDESLEEVEPKLKKAAVNGVLIATEAYAGSKAISLLKKMKSQEFKQTFSTMNAVMKEDVVQSFSRAISNVIRNFRNKMNDPRYSILDEAVRKTYEGKARQSAVAEAIRQMIDENVSGYIDRAGRKWSAEAYANMYCRTNVHNMSIDVVQKRNEDYGNDLIQVDKHAGARPLCAPYQGKIFSTSGRSGTVKDALGKKHRFKPLSSTSYGEPAGLFGINCGHNPIPFIPGISTLVNKPLTKAEIEENDEVYQESQRQRAIEREIRKAKTEVVALKKAGLEDSDDFAKASAKIKRKQEKMKLFIAETGRTRRTDRERVISFNKDIFSESNQAAKNYTLKKGYDYAVKKGDISSFVTLDIYKQVATKVEKDLVGKTTKDGIMITGYKTHFIDRVIGQYESSNEPIKGMRKGVPIGDVLATLENPDKITEKESNGYRSHNYVSNLCNVTVNPDTGNLIQANPRGGRNK